jgi:hypothetical protein
MLKGAGAREDTNMRFRSGNLIPLAFLGMLLLGCEHTTSPTTPVDWATGQIVFGSYIGDGWPIYIVKSNGTGLTKLADGIEICISPAGRSVLFTATSGPDRNNICVIGVDGGSVRNLTNSALSCSDAH